MIKTFKVFQMNKEPSHPIKTAEHLFEIYPSMPRYANDPEESEVVKTYDFILRRFQGFYSKQPAYFVKCGTSPVVFGDYHSYSGYPYFAFSSTQDIIVAVAKTSSDQIRINNYQSAIYGEKALSSKASQWKFEEKEGEEKFMYGFIKILATIAEQFGLKDLGGMDLLIYSGAVEDQFIAWKEAVYACFYTAANVILSKNKPVDSKQVTAVLKKIAQSEHEITQQFQMFNYKPGCLSLHNAPKPVDVAFPPNLSIVLAHSMTPLPKKLIHGKRFNLRRCEILIALQYIKNIAGTTKDFQSLKQIQEFIGCTTEELIKEVEENIPLGPISAETIEQFADRSLIDILKQVPYANSVIDQNKEFSPRQRALFFLKQELMLSKLTPQNMIDSVRQSFKNQVELLEIGSEQIDKLIQVAAPWTLAHKIVGNGWGGNVLLLCEKAKASKLVDELMSSFYLSEENKVLLSDGLEQYVHCVESPGTGLAILNPESTDLDRYIRIIINNKSQQMAMAGVSHFQNKINKAVDLKNEGNVFFKAHDYDQARNKYQEALQLLEPSTFYGASEVQCQKLAEISANLLFNVGTCCFNQSKWRDAELLYSEAITVNKYYVKAIFKRAMARYHLNDYERAMADIKEAHNLDKSNADILEGYEKIRAKYNEQIKKDNEKRKELSSKIFSPNKKPEEEKKKQEKGSNWWLLSLVPLAAVAAYHGLKFLRNS